MQGPNFPATHIAIPRSLSLSVPLSSHPCCCLCDAPHATMAGASGICTMLLAALLLASCASPACARGRSLLQMQNLQGAATFGKDRLTAKQVPLPHGMRAMRSRFRVPAACSTCIHARASDAELGAWAGMSLAAQVAPAHRRLPATEGTR